MEVRLLDGSSGLEEGGHLVWPCKSHSVFPSYSLQSQAYPDPRERTENLIFNADSKQAPQCSGIRSYVALGSFMLSWCYSFYLDIPAKSYVLIDGGG